MKSLIWKNTRMRKLITSVGYVVYALLYITGNKTRNIELSNVSLTLKYHQFEVVNSEILDIEGQKYEGEDNFSRSCDLCLSLHKWE